MPATTEIVEKKSFSTELGEQLDLSSDALPRDFNKARFVQNSIALLNEHPELGKYSRSQLLAGLLKGSCLGLDFYNKEAYLVPYGDNLNYQTSYIGSKKLCKKYSIRPIKDIYAKIVREGDVFEETIVNGVEGFKFSPKPFNDGSVIGAFAVCLFEDGGMLVDTMSLKDLENTRRSSKASNSPAWNRFTTEMYKKTVLRRLCKHIELDFENPTQRANYDAEMEIETNPEEVQRKREEESANSVDFPDVEEAEFKEV